MNHKILIVSLGYEGGCLYYANSIIRRLSSSVSYDLIVSSSSDDIPVEATIKLPLFKGLLGQLFFLWFSPIVFIYIFISALIKYDKLIVFGPNNFDCLFLFVFKLLNKDNYLVIHDGVMHEGERDNFHQKILNLAMKQASFHIFLTEYVAHRVHSHLNIIKPYFIIPHGPIVFGSPKESHIGSNIRLLVIGRLSPYKGLHIISEIIPLLKSYDCTLTIAGSLSSEMRPLFEKEDGIDIIDHYLTEEEINTLLNECDVILMPYTEASQSGIAAMSIGYCKPAIITKVGGLPEQLSREEAFYMESIDSASLISQISLIKKDKNVYYRKIKNLEAKRQKMSWEKITEEFEIKIVNHNCL